MGPTSDQHFTADGAIDGEAVRVHFMFSFHFDGIDIFVLFATIVRCFEKPICGFRKSTKKTRIHLSATVYVVNVLSEERKIQIDFTLQQKSENAREIEIAKIYKTRAEKNTSSFQYAPNIPKKFATVKVFTCWKSPAFRQPFQSIRNGVIFSVFSLCNKTVRVIAWCSPETRKKTQFSVKLLLLAPSFEKRSPSHSMDAVRLDTI